MKNRNPCEKKSLRPFSCTYTLCKQKFGNQQDLITHLRAHRHHKEFKCSCEPNCCKSFSTHYCMTKHEHIHEGEKPFKCGLCGQSFSQISNLRRHERVHNGERPYECTICQKKFSTSSNHKQHMLVHQEKNDRPNFLCQKCQRNYYYKASLKKHMQSSHRASIDASQRTDSKLEELEEQISKKVFITPTANIVIPDFTYHEMFQKRKELAQFWELNTQAYFKTSSISVLASSLFSQLSVDSQKALKGNKEENDIHNEILGISTRKIASPEIKKTENATEKK